jgi:hypothetical protein
LESGALNYITPTAIREERGRWRWDDDELCAAAFSLRDDQMAKGEMAFAHEECVEVYQHNHYQPRGLSVSSSSNTVAHTTSAIVLDYGGLIFRREELYEVIDDQFISAYREEQMAWALEAIYNGRFYIWSRLKNIEDIYPLTADEKERLKAALEAELKLIPERHARTNLGAYKLLLHLEPENSIFIEKVNHYKEVAEMYHSGSRGKCWERRGKYEDDVEVDRSFCK